jgi:homoserine dehydrogenase
VTRAIRLDERAISPMAEVETRDYLRVSVYDRPGVLARIAGALGEAAVQGALDAIGATVG